MNVPAIIYDFKAIGGTLRKGRLDDWWKLAKPKPGSKADLRGNMLCREFEGRLSRDSHDPFAGCEARVLFDAGIL
jgi:hypothetical protein